MSDFLQIFQPGLRHWKEQQDLEKVFVVDNEAGGTGPRPLDLESGSVVIRVRADERHTGAMDPIAPEPDTKDWTEVETTPCAECGYDADTVEVSEVTAAVLELTDPWQEILASPEAAQRPSEQVWSPLEYGCHVTEVLLLFRQRLGQMLTEPEPTFPNWDQDAAAVAHRYWEQEPAAVASRLSAAARDFVGVWNQVRPEEWTRSGRRSDGAPFTVASLGIYLVHELSHHLHDVIGD